MLVIRPATENDSVLLLNFISQLAMYEKLSSDVIATEESIKKYLFGEKKYAESLIAEYDKKPIGFALYFYNFSTFLSLPGIYLEDLFVETDFRGKGVGKSLLLELVRIAKEKGFGRVEWAVLDWNSPSINFYKTLGAKPNDEWTVYRLKSDQFKKQLQTKIKTLFFLLYFFFL